MIKRIMYFYDKKQADLIKKVNDKLHRQRGIRVVDGINSGKAAQILRDAAEYTRMITNFKSVPEELKSECKQVASQMMKLANKIQSLK